MLPIFQNKNTYRCTYKQDTKALFMCLSGCPEISILLLFYTHVVQVEFPQCQLATAKF